MTTFQLLRIESEYQRNGKHDPLPLRPINLEELLKMPGVRCRTVAC